MTDLKERLRKEADEITCYASTVTEYRPNATAKLLREAADAIERLESDCVCRGNWRRLVKECESLFGKKFRDDRGDEYTFYGLVHADDDYYYGMVREGRDILLSCVGTIEGHGFTLIDAAKGER